jgi:hypothetical protein
MAPFRLDWEPGQAPLPGGPAKGAEPAPTAKAPIDVPPSSGGPSKLEAHAPLLPAGETIAIDGKGSDAAWSKAKVVQWDTDYAGEVTGIPTRARFLWSKEGLYALFELSNLGFNTDQSKPINVERQGLYKEDCVEIFLTPDPSAPKRYYEVELGPFGHSFDLGVDRDAKTEDIGWSSGAKIATTRNTAARTAVIEALLTAPSIAQALKPGARLPMNLFRMEGKDPRRYLAWSPPRTKKPNFHVPEAFGLLVLDP